MPREPMHSWLARMTTATRLMGGYAIAALLIAVAGTYALLAYLVGQRRQELAIRLALGAAPSAIVRLVAREAAWVVGLGVAVGLASAALASRFLSGLLYGVASLDAGVIAAVVSVAAIVGIAAAVVPAQRAARVDPSDTLRAGG